jgi:hypothetical protein
MVPRAMQEPPAGKHQQQFDVDVLLMQCTADIQMKAVNICHHS